MTAPRRRALAWVAAVLAVAPGAAAGQVVAAAGPSAGPDPRCVATLRAWAAGASAPVALATFGARLRASPSTPEPDAADPALRVALGAGITGFSGSLLAGAMREDGSGGYAYPGPRAAGPAAGGGRLRVEGTHSGLVAALDVAVGRGRPTVRALGVGRPSPTVSLWAGALPLRTGPTCAEGLVLGGGGGPAWGLEAAWTEGISLPLLGRLRLAAQLGTLAEAGPGNRNPVLHVLRAEVHPTPGLVLGVQRATLFGGTSSDVPMTPRTVGLMLLGFTDTEGKDSDFENQVASADARWRASLGGRPALFTAEYGADDSGYAFVRVPGLRVTASTRRGPHPRGWTGFEVVHMAAPTERYPSWYRHGALSWGWTDRGTLLGSPLGGEGTLVAATWGVAGPGLNVDLLAGAARRGPQNLLAGPGGDRVATGRASVQVTRGAWDLATVATLTAGASSALRVWVSAVRAF